MKKLICAAICFVMLLSLLPVTVLAADEIDFTLRIQEETDNELILVLDYDGGVGFSALDVDISFDRLRLELKSCEKGEGYIAFEKYLEENGHASICSVNSQENPMRISMANTMGFKTISGLKSVVVMKFAKVPGTKFAKEDVTFEFTNCQTASFTDIKVNFDYDLAAPVTKTESGTGGKGDGGTEYPQQTSADNVEGVDDSEFGVDIENDEFDANGSGEGSVADNDTLTNKETDGSNKKTVVVIAAAVVGVAVFGVAVFFIIKKKKNNG